jgi:hypothetical protein
MNPEIKQLAHEAAHMARSTADETGDYTIRQLALSVFGLAKAIESAADHLPEKPEPRRASTKASEPHSSSTLPI